MFVLAFISFRAFLAQITADVDPTVLAGEMLKAIGSGQWVLVAVLAVIGATVLARRVGGRYLPWLNTTAGAITVSVLGSIGAAVATALLAGQPFTVALLLKAVFVALIALAPSAAAKPPPVVDAAPAPAKDMSDIVNGRP